MAYPVVEEAGCTSLRGLQPFPRSLRGEPRFWHLTVPSLANLHGGRGAAHDGVNVKCLDQPREVHDFLHSVAFAADAVAVTVESVRVVRADPDLTGQVRAVNIGASGRSGRQIGTSAAVRGGRLRRVRRSGWRGLGSRTRAGGPPTGPRLLGGILGAGDGGPVLVIGREENRRGMAAADEGLVDKVPSRSTRRAGTGHSGR